MNPWPFVTTAYLAVVLGGGVLVAWSYIAMRRAERAAEAATRR